MEAMITEYGALRNEIIHNFQSTIQFFTVTVTATAALLGYSLQKEQSNWLLFLTPFAILIPTMWFILAEFESTWRIATYISVFIEPDIPGLEWENHLYQFKEIKNNPDSVFQHSIVWAYGALGATSIILSFLSVLKKVSFKLTDEDYEKLKKEDLSEDILEKLKVLEHQSVIAKINFIDAFKKVIGAEQNRKYKWYILKNALSYFPKGVCAVLIVAMILLIFPMAKIWCSSPDSYLKEWKRILEKKSFELTEQSYDKLEKENLPGDIVEKLKVLKHHIFIGKICFINAIKEKIGDEQTIKYKSYILRSARKELNITYFE